MARSSDTYHTHRRTRWRRVPFTSSKPPPPPQYSISDSPLIPEANANILSLITFGWISGLLSLGYSRPLVAGDLYKLQDDRSAASIADKINESFDRRKREAEEFNARLAKGDISPGIHRFWWSDERKKQWREKDGMKKASLVLAMNDSVKWWFWSSGFLKVIGDTAQVTSPLVVKAIIQFVTESYVGRRSGTGSPPSIGKGIGLAICLFLLQIISSLCTNHFFYRSTSAGVLLRGGLITAIYTRSLRLTSRARSTITNGKLVNHISTDVSRIDFCAGFFHMAWTAPIQLIICLILLLLNLGPSALAGFAFFVLATPIQTWVMKKLFALRRNSMVWTDKRAKLLQELLGGMKVIKYFAWEDPFLKRIEDYRRREMADIRSLLLIRAAMNAVAMSMPALASVLAFVTYSATGHELEPGVIFASLTLFNLLRFPLMFLPVSLSAIADAANATNRLYGVFEAELLDQTLVVDENLDAAVTVEHASFTWDAPPPDEADGKGKKKKHHSRRRENKERIAADAAAAALEEKDEEKPFEVKDVDLSIPRGKLVAIVGPVGSGKSSFLQGLLGEMRRTKGATTFGGSVAYCPQSAWIQNATIRENICFGRPFEEERYWKAVRDACLEPDLAMFQYGDLTEVGEKGISLSGGQKQRLNICRAIYCNTDIQIFDDPLSALDAHVGKAVFHNVLQNSLSGKTRILVTHALHFLPEVDYIYVISDGRVVEQGTYANLMAHGKAFSQFVTEFGTNEEHKEEEEVSESKDDEAASVEEPLADVKKAEGDGEPAAVQQAPSGPGLMQEEERNTGAVSLDVYKAYVRAGRGGLMMPTLFLSLALIQGATVMSSYWLVWWQEGAWNQTPGFFMGIYAALGVGQALFTFTMGAAFAMLTFFASQRLHKGAISRIMHAPMSFFETTVRHPRPFFYIGTGSRFWQPLGRIMNRFSKDIDTIDNMLGDALRMFSNTFCSILGAIILISIVLPWFLIAVAVILLAYIWAAAFYRSSARELKRLDSILRSSLYSHFSESLSGLATIRAYGESRRFILENQTRVDVENRAYWLTVTNQRWLGIRLDFLGGLLTFIVALLTVGTRFVISPAQTGLVLSYILSVQAAFGWMVRQTAEVENNMNSVERIDYYANEVEQEAKYEIPEKKPDPDWPKEGRVYRPGLPAVLKGLSMDVNGGEKIGIVGRYTLYRLVELSSGKMVIDGVDISEIGLFDLRSHLAIIPQDPVISGTLRSNLDPFNQHEDGALWDALKRSYLVDTPQRASIQVTEGDTPAGSGAQTPVNRFTLDTVIEDEGGNLSIGQRSLVSLARALVKNAKIIILDEATASVDYETDRNIQDTIAHEFKDKTILCIAPSLPVTSNHSLQEYDTPENLYHHPDGIFRGMCERSSITLEDIRLARTSWQSRL
ncbi:ATP-binding cassette transporter YOR1 [Coprinopsis sp. MPI-PUGE-AT-0042]|nr:ATP-binding cassette transporter YOR1 [Coprinopsis sp. MPI-PUGE-AT-0042]